MGKLSGYKEPEVQPQPGEQPQPGKETQPKEPSIVIKKGEEPKGLLGMEAAIASANYLMRDLVTDDGVPEGSRVWVDIGSETNKHKSGTKFKNEHKDVKVGVDNEIGNELTTRLEFGYSKGKGKYNFGSKGDLEAYYIQGKVAQKVSKDGTVMLSMTLGRVENDYKVASANNHVLSGKYKNIAYGVGARYGHKVEFDGSYVEPFAQMNLTHMPSKSSNATSTSGNKIKIDTKSSNSVLGKVGVKVGKTMDAASIYGKVTVNHEFNGDVENSYSLGANRETRKTKGQETWSDAMIGGAYNIAPGVKVSLEVSKGVAGDYQKNWKAETKVTYTF